MTSQAVRDVLLIYTGGTLGSLPRDPADPLSPLAPAGLERVLALLPHYDPVGRRLALGDRTLRLGAHTFDVPLDSANMTARDWVAIAEVIRDNHDGYAGFVVLHGTDTLAFTASALAFMFDGLTKPVVITGAQRPIGRLRTDAVQNLVTAIEIAAAGPLGAPVIPEVTVFFRDVLLRGCRATKLAANAYAAFASPNVPPLATAGASIVVDESRVRAGASDHAGLSVQTELEPGIACIELFPGMSADLLDHMLCAEGLRGIVLKTFGAGNGPSAPAFLNVIGRSVAAGRVIVDVSQCVTGEVELGAYEVSAGLLARGVVSGMDMTTEAALTKLATVLGAESDPVVAADLMQLNLRGEQRRSIFQLHYDAGGAPAGSTATLPPARPMTGAERYTPSALERAVLRLTGLELRGRTSGRAELRIWLGSPADGAAPLATIDRHWRAGEPGGSVAFFDVTDAVRDHLDPAAPLTVTAGGEALSWQRLDLALYADA